MSRRRNNPPTVIGPGPEITTITAHRFHGRDDVILSQRIGFLDEKFRDAVEILSKGCPVEADRKKIAETFDYIGKEYFQLKETLKKDSTTSPAVMEKLNKIIDEIIFYKQKLKADILQCELQNIKLSSPGGDNLNNMTSETLDKEDQAIYEKILKTKITNYCNLRSFKDYAGGDVYEKFFQDQVITPFVARNFSRDMRGQYGVLLYGPPGTGKTLMAEAVAEKLLGYGASFYSITSSTIKGKYVGESEKSIRFLFQLARRDTNGGKRPVVIFIDEVDGLLDDSKGGAEGSSGDTGILSQLNSELEGLGNTNNKGIILIMATNFPEKMPAAALSRMSANVYVGLPDEDEIRSILVKFFTRIGKPRFDIKVNYDEIKIRSKYLQNNGDDLDVIVTYLKSHYYAPREIQKLLNNLNVICYGLSNEFIVSDRFDNSDSIFINYQIWLVQVTTFKTKIMNDKNECVERLEEDVELWIPIAYIDNDNVKNYSNNETNIVNLLRNNEDMNKTALDEKKNKNYIMVIKRDLRKKSNDSDKQLIDYRIVYNGKNKKLVNMNIDLSKFWSENKNDIKNNNGEKISSQIVNFKLGPVRIILDHIMNALAQVRPVQIKNGTAMINFTKQFGISLKPEKDNKQLEDLIASRISDIIPTKKSIQEELFPSGGIDTSIISPIVTTPISTPIPMLTKEEVEKKLNIISDREKYLQPLLLSYNIEINALNNKINNELTGENNVEDKKRTIDRMNNFIDAKNQIEKEFKENTNIKTLYTNSQSGGTKIPNYMEKLENFEKELNTTKNQTDSLIKNLPSLST